MAQFNIGTATDDELYARWQEQIERIRTETTYLFTTRFRWREVVKMFEYNQALNKVGGPAYQWLLGIWGRDAIMAVRRELDDQHGAVNLVHMLHEIEKRPQVLTRRRYLAHIKPSDPDFLTETMNEDFNRFGCVTTPGGDPDEDHIDPTVVRADRQHLQEEASATFEYAQQMVAHRTPIDKLEIQISDIHRAIDAIHPVLRKYYVILTGNGIATSEAAFQYHWKEAFEHVWANSEYYERLRTEA